MKSPDLLNLKICQTYSWRDPSNSRTIRCVWLRRPPGVGSFQTVLSRVGHGDAAEADLLFRFTQFDDLKIVFVADVVGGSPLSAVRYTPVPRRNEQPPRPSAARQTLPQLRRRRHGQGNSISTDEFGNRDPGVEAANVEPRERRLTRRNRYSESRLHIMPSPDFMELDRVYVQERSLKHRPSMPSQFR